jgi:hypothetical protein
MGGLKLTFIFSTNRRKGGTLNLSLDHLAKKCLAASLTILNLFIIHLNLAAAITTFGNTLAAIVTALTALVTRITYTNNRTCNNWNFSLVDQNTLILTSICNTTNTQNHPCT